MKYEEMIDEAEIGELLDFLKDLSDDGAGRFKQRLGERLALTGDQEKVTANELRYQLMRFLVDEQRSRVKVQALADPRNGFDLDESVLQLWLKLNSVNDWVTQEHKSKTYHERRLVAWFLDRYALSQARRVYTQSIALYEGLQFVPLAGTSVALFLILSRDRIGWSFAAVLIAYAAAILVWKVSGYSALDFVQSLVPRLAGTAAAGAALLLSAAELLKFLHKGMSVYASLALLAFAALYLVLEIEQRVRPRLRRRELTNRVVNVVVLALSHAAAIVIALLPAIRFVRGGSESFSWVQLVAVTSAVFTGGLVLNVIWAEEPVTRPL